MGSIRYITRKCQSTFRTKPLPTIGTYASIDILCQMPGVNVASDLQIDGHILPYLITDGFLIYRNYAQYVFFRRCIKFSQTANNEKLQLMRKISAHDVCIHSSDDKSFSSPRFGFQYLGIRDGNKESSFCLFTAECIFPSFLGGTFSQLI